MSSLSSLTIDLYAAKMGVSLRHLICQSVAVIPGSIMSAKIAFPETDPSKPLTRSRESTMANRKNIKLRKAKDLLDSASDGTLVAFKAAAGVV